MLITVLVLVGVFFFLPLSVVNSANKSAPVEVSNENSLKKMSSTSYKVSIEEFVEFSNQEDIDGCLDLISRTLKVMPESHVSAIDEIVVSFNPYMRRGLGGGGKITMRCYGVTEEEFVAVLVHELGHVVDTDGLKGARFSGSSGFYDGSVPIFRDDPSVRFYGVSWEKSGSMRNGVTDNDFCSGYGSSDHFEDFAECYTFYVLNEKTFRQVSGTNSQLRKKYLFIKNVVFAGKHYLLSQQYFPDDMQPYDTTVLPYSLSEFLLSPKSN